MNFLLFNGALNNTVFGLQIYFWLMLAGIIAVGMSEGIWQFFFWLPLKPLHGHFTAHIGKINSAFVFDENLHFNLKSEKKAKLIYDETVKEAKEAQKGWKYAPSGLIGKVLTDLIFDGGRWTDLESRERDEIERVADLWNEQYPDDQVRDLFRFHQYLKAGKFSGMGVADFLKPTYRVSWLRIDKAIPRNHIQPMWDGFLRQHAERERNDGDTSTNTYCYIILGMSMLICAGMIAVKFLK